MRFRFPCSSDSIRARYGAPRGTVNDKAMVNKSSLWPYGLPLIGLLAFLRKRKRDSVSVARP